MTRLRGRARRGQRVHASAPCGRWQTTTMISSIRLDGTTASMTIPGPTDAEVFRTYVRDILCPTLQAGDIVIMDNLSSHKNEATLGLLAEVGAEVRFLPAYSPDFNPIEKMWSKLKANLRKAEARTPQDLDEAIGAALLKVTAKDARGWFASSGYNFI